MDGASSRLRVLPAQGHLLISTDLHGNLEDFHTLRALFLAARGRGEDVHWALLGDSVHGPDERARQAQPELYDYPDQSGPLVEELAALLDQHPERVHYVLGNHDHGHVGGRHTHKFHDDEVQFLEQAATPAQRRALHAVFQGAALALIAPCGALLAHGSPGDRLTDLSQLTRLPPFGERYTAEQSQLVQSFLWSYGQTAEVTARVLQVASRAGPRLTMVIHGHDRDEWGWYVEGGNQAQPVIFGAPRAQKRYLWLDLAAHYPEVGALREGVEIRRLYPAPALAEAGERRSS
jgi:hypothetical protein